MKKMRRAMLLAGCAVSALGLASCSSDEGNRGNDANRYGRDAVVYKYAIVNYGESKPYVLYEINTYDYVGRSYSENSLKFTTKLDNKSFIAHTNWYLFEEKPAKELYDVEYGTKEWYDLTGNIETQSQNASYTFELTK
ncbi:MAG TPA: hypothetical protein DCO89_02930 [Clostridiales bacterium]|nr:hypothetical protein [Clostridiales bacterium]